MDDTLTQTSLVPYQYTRLAGPSWIRVLQLHGADGFEDELVCNIIHLDRNCLFASTDKTRNHYQTVSYAWGEPNFDTDLVCEEDTSARSVIKITLNVGTMLRHFRKKHKSLNLWIDAVCLNQSDRDEIQQQLQLMGRIFSESAKTRIWLGDSFDGMQEVFAIFRMIVIATQPMKTVLASQNERTTIGDKLRRMPEQTLHEIFRRPWFRRRWILQELYLARNAVIMCGGERIAWNDFAQVLRRSQDFATGLVWKADILAHARGLCHQTRRTKSGLLDVLWNHRHHNCSDLRDIIFAVLGFAHTYGVSVRHIRYDQPHHLIFRDFAAACISGGQLEVVLDHVAAFGGLNKRHAGVPSWTPDWTSKPSRPGFLGNSLRNRWLSVGVRSEEYLHCAVPIKHVCLPRYGQHQDDQAHFSEHCPASVFNFGLYVHTMQQAVIIRGFLSLPAEPLTWQEAVTSFCKFVAPAHEKSAAAWTLAPFLFSLLKDQIDIPAFPTSEFGAELSAVTGRTNAFRRDAFRGLQARIESLYDTAVAARVLSVPEVCAFADEFYHAWLRVLRGGMIFYSESFQDEAAPSALNMITFQTSRLIGYVPRDVKVGDFVVVPDLPRAWSQYLHNSQSQAFLFKTERCDRSPGIAYVEHPVLDRAFTGYFQKAIPVANLFEKDLVPYLSDLSLEVRFEESREYYRGRIVSTGGRHMDGTPECRIKRTLLSSIEIL